MVPLPIAILGLYYGTIAALSSAKLLRILSGTGAGSSAWQVLWLALCAAATVGLALLKPWGRRLAIWTAGVLMATLLASALMVVGLTGRGRLALALACAAALQMLPIRYLRRPTVKRLFSGERCKVRG
ncbi:MAG: hypothetical protein HYZ92_02110 [Candidatus Omnitrophica bacterium]|nr:hypothetical protein [Candidatus Omnitrophota bacterium]